MQTTLNNTKKLIRAERIATLGGFGAKRVKVVPDSTKYNRKVKYQSAWC